MVMAQQEKIYHFISGLPRAGSTLLAAILRQNPRFYARMSSPVSSIVNQTLDSMGKSNEFSIFISDQQKHDILRGVVTNYYQSIKGEVIFDSNRYWCSKIYLVKQLFSSAKIITCIRNPAWIMDSIESLIRRNSVSLPGLFNNLAEASTVYTRTTALGQQGRLVGYAYEALREAYYSNQSASMLLVEYDVLTQFPELVMQEIYQFIGEEYFVHDFDNLEYEENEFDQMMQVPGLHTVKHKVEYRQRKTILPPDLFQQFANLAFWEQDFTTQAQRITPPKSGDRRKR